MMKKTYIKPESELVLLRPTQILMGSPGAGDMPDPGIGSREFLFDDEELDIEKMLSL